MRSDPELEARVHEFVALNPATEMHRIYSCMHVLLFTWAGVAEIEAPWDDEQIDRRVAVVLKKVGYPEEPKYPHALYEAYGEIYRSVMECLLIQGPFCDVFQNASYDFEADRLALNDTLDTVLAHAQVLAPRAGTNDHATYWSEIARIVVAHHAALGTTPFEARVALDRAAGYRTDTAPTDATNFTLPKMHKE